MNAFVAWLRSIPVPLLVLACLTLGLAPFRPPHLVEKLQMLAAGTLKRPIDVFDLVLHGSPWVLLVARLVVAAIGGRGEAGAAR